MAAIAITASCAHGQRRADHGLPNVSSQVTVTDFANFCSSSGTDCPFGSLPDGGILQGADGNFYGVTNFDGQYGQGVFFRLSPTGVGTMVYSFNGGLDGGPPPSGIIQGSDGNFYGLQTAAVIRLTPSGQLQTIHSFGVTGNLNGPYTLTQGSDGDLYGIHASTAFRLKLDGTGFTGLTLPPGFFGNSSALQEDGLFGGLLQALDGNFYGTTGEGGSGYGTIFEINPSTGEVSVLYSFTGGSDGAYANAGLVQGSDGNLYGSTGAGGNDNLCAGGGPPPETAFYGCGVVFKYVLQGPSKGTLVPLYEFQANSDGALPLSPPIVGSDGNLYGVTSGGAGSIYEVDQEGTFTSLYDFSCENDPFSCPVGVAPESSPVQADDGMFYGTTPFGGGPSEGGAVYSFFPTANMAPPIRLQAPTAEVGKPVTVTFSSSNSFSTSMQQCYAFATNESTGAFYTLGRVPATLNGLLYQGQFTETPTVPGAYLAAVTCGGVESGTLTVEVLADGKLPTITTLTASPNPVVLGSEVQMSAQVARSDGSAVPTGMVDFYVGTALLGRAQLSDQGLATLSVSTSHVPNGDYYVKAEYTGDSSNSASNSSTLLIQAGLGDTTITLTNPDPQNGEGLNYLITSVSGPITGSISYFASGQLLGTFDIAGRPEGSVFYDDLFTMPGTYQITAQYNGSPLQQSCISAPVTAIVTSLGLD
jgi:uncharacterized repeat protein (TIGR03803 family)